MMSKIYLAWNPLAGDVVYDKHLYIVKDVDENLATTSDQFLIRGSAENNQWFDLLVNSGYLFVQQVYSEMRRSKK